MMQTLVIGLGAGAAAALMFASLTSGAALSIVLFYLAPLPIMIAALGWNHRAGLIAVVAAAVILAGVFGFSLSAMFLGTIAAPAWWLGYLALLGRAVTTPDGADVEWYPTGRLVLWAAMLGAALVTCALLAFGTDEAAVTAGLTSALDHLFRLQAGLSPDAPLRFPGIQDMDRLIDLLVAAIPPAAAIIGTLTQIGNLWLAGRIVQMSGRLTRPWPDLSAVSFTPIAAALLGAVIAGSFLPGLPGLVASLFTATLAIAFAFVGFAVLHAVTRGLRNRGLMLGGAYGIVAVLGWPVLLMTLIGVAETLFGLRARVARSRLPALPKP